MLLAAESGRAMLVGLSIMAQRYCAVMELIAGVLVTEVAWLDHATVASPMAGVLALAVR
jgi:hypothetical protein